MSSARAARVLTALLISLVLLTAIVFKNLVLYVCYFWAQMIVGDFSIHCSSRLLSHKGHFLVLIIYCGIYQTAYLFYFFNCFPGSLVSGLHLSDSLGKHYTSI